MVSAHDYVPLSNKDVGLRPRDEDDEYSYRKRTAPYPSRLYLVMSSVLIIISFFAGAFIKPLHWRSPYGNDSSPGYQGFNALNALNALVPQFPKMYKEFNFNRTFMKPPGDEDTTAWVSMIPKGKGIVKLPTGESFPDDTFNFAVYHQLHCLYTLRQSFWAFYHITNNTSVGTDRNMTYMLLHGNHCFEYLRQAVSCNVDTTLEPFAVERDTFRVWGVQHRCTDFDKVGEWATSMRRNDQEGIVN